MFRARYLGSTQLISDGQPSKAVRMLQAQEAISRIKVPYVHTYLCLLMTFTHVVISHKQNSLSDVMAGLDDTLAFTRLVGLIAVYDAI